MSDEKKPKVTPEDVKRLVDYWTWAKKTGKIEIHWFLGGVGTLKAQEVYLTADVDKLVN